MKAIHISRTIAAPLDVVFRAVSDVSQFSDAVPHITRIEFLSDQKVGAGTRFRETRQTDDREDVIEIEITECVDNDRVRTISDAGGTIWDTLFTVSEGLDHVILDMRMDIRPHTLFARIVTPLIRGSVTKAVAADMDAIKVFCESKNESAG